MSKITAALLPLFVLTGSFAEACAQDYAEQPYKNWNKYLKGEWTYKITAGDMTEEGTARWRPAAKGNALIGRFKDQDGNTAVEIGGWRADTKTMVGSGYGSKGNYWHLEFTKVTGDVIEGPNHGILIDGRGYKGTFTGKRVADDRYEFHFEGKTSDGNDLTMVGKFKRKAD